MNGDNLFFEKMAKSLEVNNFVNEMVKARILYNDLKEIADNGLANEQARFEAYELTKDGIYSMIGKIARMS